MKILADLDIFFAQCGMRTWDIFLLAGTDLKSMQEVRKVLKPTTKARVLYSLGLPGLGPVGLLNLQQVQHPAQDNAPNTVPDEVVINIFQKVV